MIMGKIDSNLAAWAKWLGIHDIPQWLQDSSIDFKVIIGALVVSAGYAFIVWGPKRDRLHSSVKTTRSSEIICLGTLCCYLARESKWAQGQLHNPAFAIIVGNEIRDAFFSGKITAYGRPFSPESPRHLLMTRPRRKIDPSWWENKLIPVWRAINSIGFENVVYENSQQRSGYHDITVEYASVEATWPPR